MVSPFQPGTIWISRQKWDLSPAGEPPIKPGDIFMVVEVLNDGSIRRAQGVDAPDHLRVLKDGRAREIVIWGDDAVPCDGVMQ